MERKILATAILAIVLISGASAQLMFGLNGALHMDKQMTATEIKDAFQKGEGIWIGGFGEIAFGRLGFGISGNFTPPYEYIGDIKWMDLDVAGYLSYHFFKARALLDPFVELGGGYIGSDYAGDDVSQAADPDPNNPVSATLYWYGGLGLGVNLGPIGVFGKLAFNNDLNRALKDDAGVDIPAYGPWHYDDLGNLIVDRYLPMYKFTLGAKLIL